jgi:hypothetical protein
MALWGWRATRRDDFTRTRAVGRAALRRGLHAQVSFAACRRPGPPRPGVLRCPMTGCSPRRVTVGQARSTRDGDAGGRRRREATSRIAGDILAAPDDLARCTDVIRGSADPAGSHRGRPRHRRGPPTSWSAYWSVAEPGPDDALADGGPTGSIMPGSPRHGGVAAALGSRRMHAAPPRSGGAPRGADVGRRRQPGAGRCPHDPTTAGGLVNRWCHGPRAPCGCSSC